MSRLTTAVSIFVLLAASAFVLAWPLRSRSMPNDVDRQPPVAWRRTCRGWENSDTWVRLRPPAPVQGVHPAVIATLALLLSVGALFALSPRIVRK